MLRKRFVRQKFGFRKDFRWRGHEVSRIESFSDAVFAFAVTLLVVSLEVPETFTQLVETMRGFFAFAICFAMLFSLWYYQYIFFRQYGMKDGFTITLNAILLFVVLFYVYPLKFVFTFVVNMFMGAHQLVHLADGSVVPVVERTQAGMMMVIYGGGVIAVFLLFALLHLHAYLKREKLKLTELEIHDTRTKIVFFVLNMAVGLMSVGIVLVGGEGYSGVAGFSYFLLGPTLGIHGAVAGRRRKKLAKKLEVEFNQRSRDQQEEPLQSLSRKPAVSDETRHRR